VILPDEIGSRSGLATSAVATRGWPHHGGGRRAGRITVVGRDRARDKLGDLALHVACAEAHQSQRRPVPEYDDEEPYSDRHREHLMFSDLPAVFAVAVAAAFGAAVDELLRWPGELELSRQLGTGVRDLSQLLIDE